MAAEATKTPRYVEAAGRRKTSVARIRITPSTKSSIIVNDKPLATYFPTKELQGIVNAAFKTTEMEGVFLITIKVKGGGVHSQAEAVRQAAARVLSLHKPELRTTLKQAHMLTRDPRSKERRKFGLKKARKAPQWSKR